MKRVVVDARLEHGRGGGVQQGIVALSKALSAASTTEFEISYATLQGLDDWVAEMAPGARRHQQSVGHQKKIAKLLRDVPFGQHIIHWGVRRQRGKPPTPSSQRFESWGADVVHFPTQKAELVDRPFLYHPWDLQHRHLPELFDAAERDYRDLHYRTYCHHAASVVVPTQAVADDIAHVYGIDERKISVVVPWAPSATKPVVADRLIDEPYVLYPAQSWPHKNHERLFEAVALLRSRGTTTPTVVCTGVTNERRPLLEQRVRSLGVEASVKIHGYLSDAEMQSLFCHAEGLIFPSLFEGWGYPVVEAMEAGIPVACSQGAYLDDAAGTAALRFDPTEVDAIASALVELSRSDTSGELIAAGRRHIDQWSWDRIGSQYLSIYRRLTA